MFKSAWPIRSDLFARILPRVKTLPFATTRLGIEAKFLFDLWVHARLLCFRVPKRSHFSTVISLLGRVQITPPAHMNPDQIAAIVLNVTRRPWMMRDRRCLRQGILAYWCFKAGGYEPRIHFAIDLGSLQTEKTKAHCWITIEGRSVMNDSLPDMQTFFTFPASA